MDLGCDECLHLDEQWPAAFERRRDCHAGCAERFGLQECGSGVGYLAQAVRGHFEDADLLGRAEAVLARAQQTQSREALALERQHYVDEMLERLRAGQRAVFRDMADEDRRDAVLLGLGLQPGRGS